MCRNLQLIAYHITKIQGSQYSGYLVAIYLLVSDIEGVEYCREVRIDDLR